MADNNDKKAPPDETLTGGKPVENKESETTKETDKKILGKFKSEKELVDAYTELEGKFGEQSEEVNQSRDFARTVQPILDEIRSDPELFKKLDEKLNKGPQTNSTTADTKGKEKTNDQESKTALSDIILTQFEEKHGIDKLSGSEQSTMRQKIGDEIREITGGPYSGVDLRRLRPVLEKAYILANKDTLIEKSKLEGLVSSKEAEAGSIPSVPSSSTEQKGTALTSEEANIAEKLNLSREQYLAGKKV